MGRVCAALCLAVIERWKREVGAQCITTDGVGVLIRVGEMRRPQAEANDRPHRSMWGADFVTSILFGG
jgi:hypothetical protein